jgi:hypothetical protein
VKNPFASKHFPQPVQRKLELCMAVSQERLLTTQVAHALELIELVRDRVPVDRALEIYSRLLRLTPDEARSITTRAMARLGEQVAQAETWQDRAEDPDYAERSPRLALFRQVRDRVRGRVNEELRGWIELEAARTEVALLEAHVSNALAFVDILKNELPFSEAVELYLDSLDVRDSVAETTYHLALTKLAEQLLPESRTIPRIAAALVPEQQPPAAAD